MDLVLITIPCLSDNYAFLVHDRDAGATILFDAPEAEAIEKALTRYSLPLTHIVLTHHHADHIDGVAALVKAHGAEVIGASADAHRLPPLDRTVSPGETIDIAGHEVQVLAADGHTMGHVAYYMPDAGAAFTGDSLMAAGCGRLFEGGPEIMWQTLTGLAALPDDTLICSGHEYTLSNLKFAVTVDPDNAELAARLAKTEGQRAEGTPTVPSLLSLEKATNPFLRAADPAVKAHLGMTETADAAVFAEIRSRKDKF